MTAVLGRAAEPAAATTPWSSRPLAVARQRPRAILAGACIVLGLGALLLYAWAMAYGSDAGAPTFNSPRANSNFVIAQHVAAGGGFGVPLAHYGELPPEIAPALTPRDSARLGDRVVPKTFLSEVVLLAGALRVGDWAALLLTPVLGAAAVVGVCVLGWSVAGRRGVGAAIVGGGSAAIFAVWPAQWIVESRAYEPGDALALCAFVLGVVALWPVLAGERVSPRRAAAVGALFGLSIATRYPNLLITAIPLLLLLLSPGTARRAIVFVAAFVPLAVLGLLVLAGNLVVYGSPLTTGYALAVDELRQSVPIDSAGFFGFNLQAFGQYMHAYLLNPVLGGPLLAGVAVALVLLVRRWREPDGEALYAAIAVWTLLVLTVVYGGQEAHGVDGFVVNSSFMRYLLPAAALLIPPVVLAVTRMVAGALRSGRGRGMLAATAALALLASVLVGSVEVAVGQAGGIRDRRGVVSRLEQARTENRRRDRRPLAHHHPHLRQGALPAARRARRDRADPLRHGHRKGRLRHVEARPRRRAARAGRPDDRRAEVPAVPAQRRHRLRRRRAPVPARRRGPRARARLQRAVRPPL